jgi:tetratricopeptide (TPR) repeat protein
MYYYKRDYSKALEYYERALDIWTSLLPANHINIKSVKDSIEIVKKKL